MKRSSTSVLVLVVFVIAYVLCITAYTLTSELNGVRHMDRKIDPVYDAMPMLGRDVIEKDDNWENGMSLNVCCDRDEYLDSKLECVKVNGTVEGKIVLYSNTTRIMVNDDFIQSPIDLEKIDLRYNAKEICPANEMKVITWLEGQIYSHYISKDNGHLLELSLDRKEITSSYSPSSFCLDTMSDQEKIYVALLCLCKEQVCVPKCCPEGFYHNSVSSSCKKEDEDGIESYNPHYPKGFSYQLIHSVPNCSGPDMMILAEKELSALSVLENGHLMRLSNDKTFFSRKKYCVDIFSNGDNNSSYVNGFYCPSEALPFDGIDPSIDPTPRKLKQGVTSEVSTGSRNDSNFVKFDVVLIVFSLLFSVVYYAV